MRLGGLEELPGCQDSSRLGATDVQLFGEIFGAIYLYLDSMAFLFLSAVGLIIILGMMGITNLAHGEFMMLGAYTAVLATRAGLPFPISVVFASLMVGLFGMVLERLIIRRFYGNLLQSLVATWGISLIISQGMLVLMGPSLQTIRMPLGGITVAGKAYAAYRLLLAVIAIGLLIVMWYVFHRTKFGMRARGAMQNAEIAEAMGINTSRMYQFTFGIGSALAGFAGALYAPTTVLAPLYGASFLAPAFVTVVVSGGANVIQGALITSVLLGIIEGTSSRLYGTFIGRMALLAAAMVILRVLPTGISGYLETRGERAR
ncbi:MAG: branched-chain amino acid ABC transporter permease [Firmicutes bacterium]|jgi:branched-chain amino acid transport system permease protein|nr:branched-chain amino acid ABC transporter permease [Bacillota bacterium]